MDYGFQRFGRMRPGSRAAGDQQRLVAVLAAGQGVSATARALLAAGETRFAGDRAALVEVYAAGPRWREAAAALGHRFRRLVPVPGTANVS